ncbi:MAG: FkbM family methyltransferase [Planctomycetaceae bacterium]|nr:FkbM family methyltransferase [Planctomycetaceae bacterium]
MSKYLSQKKQEGKKTFLEIHHDWIHLLWNNFFQSQSCFQLQKKLDDLIRNLDELSKEIATRVLYTHIIMLHTEGIFSLTNFQFSDSANTPDFFPLDKEERKKTNAMKKTFRNKYIFTDATNKQNVSTELDSFFLNQYDLNYFTPDVQKIIDNKDVIDGGGLIGDTAMIFAELPVKKVYVFEPNPDTFRILEKNISLNSQVLGENIQKITPVSLALGKSCGSTTLYSNGSCDGGTSVHSRKSAKEYDVSVTSIDDYVQKNSLNVGLIKLDVEGEESNVIEGAIETIKTQKPLLIISIYHTPKDFFEIKLRLESLNIGYKFMIRQTTSECPTYYEICLLGYPE